MMVSNIMVINDLGNARRNDGARCSVGFLDGMCAQMAQPSTIGPVTSSDLPCSASTSGESTESIDDIPEPHPISRAIGAIYSMEDFEILDMLGEGFFSKVLKVRHSDTGREMVLKVSKASASSSRRSCHSDAAREANMMRGLKHSNVLAFGGICIERCGSGEWDLHLLVDYCNGGSLSRLILDRSQHFPWHIRTRFALDIGRAMEYIHAQRIIHRDLTSMNVLIRHETSPMNLSSGRAVVADFGLSCGFPKRGEKLQQVGTTYYMSPECLKEEFYDEKSDVFSFGVILCQLIARIEADPDSGLHRTINFGLDYVLFTPCCPPDTPLELLKLAFNSCLLDPVSRPSFASLKTSLEKLLNALPPSPTPERDCLKESRLGRSRSDAALKRPRALASAGRKLSSTMHYASNCTPVIEGMADDTRTISAMEELARDVARVEPIFEHRNPFLEHERYRKERKIIPRGGGRRRSETKPEGGVTSKYARRRYLRRRCASLPNEIDSPDGSFDLSIDDEEMTSPGGMPMAYRDFDMKFVKSMKRFPSRRHTMIPECLAAKSSLELQSIRTGSESSHFSSPFSRNGEGAGELADVPGTSFEENLVFAESVDPVVTRQPQSLTGSRHNSFHSIGEGGENNNVAGSNSKWGPEAIGDQTVDTVVLDNNYSSQICVPLSSRGRKNQKCNIL